MQGEGKLITKNGSFYEGYWENNELNGIGRLFHSNGDSYEGELKNGKHHG